jgi:ribosomal protein L22
MPQPKRPRSTGKPADASIAADKQKAEDPKPAPRAKTKPKRTKEVTAKAPKPAAPGREAEEAAAGSGREAEQPSVGKKPAAKKPAAKKPAAKPKAKAEEKPTPVATPAPQAAPLVRAKARYVRGSARKARLVADHIRGKDVVEARKVLTFSPRHAARDLEKLLNSAVANAEENHELVGDDLRVKEIRVDEGPTLKRWRPRAQGRATRINKRTAHLSIALTPKE